MKENEYNLKLGQNDRFSLDIIHMNDIIDLLFMKVMYMYFLLGYKYFMEPIDEAEKMTKENTP